MLSTINFSKENVATALGYTAIVVGATTAIYYLSSPLSRRLGVNNAILFPKPSIHPFISTTKHLSSVVKSKAAHKTASKTAESSTSTSSLLHPKYPTPTDSVILLQEIVWSTEGATPLCYLVWKSTQPVSIYHYSVCNISNTLRPIVGIYDEITESQYHKQLLPIIFEKDATYKVGIWAEDIVLVSFDIPAQFIEASRKSARLEYLEATSTLSLKFNMNLRPNGGVDGISQGVNVCIKIGDRDQFNVDPSTFLITETGSEYSFYMNTQIPPFDVSLESVRVEVLLFNGNKVCSSYTIERNPV